VFVFSLKNHAHAWQLLLATTVRISVGLETTTQQNQFVSQLRRNTQSKKDKTSGQKIPRTGYYDVVPTPDSIEYVSNADIIADYVHV